MTEDMRQLVIDPDNQMWLLAADGRIDRRITTEEIRSWEAYKHPAPVPFAGGLIQMPSQYIGVHYQIRRVDWTQWRALR